MPLVPQRPAKTDPVILDGARVSAFPGAPPSASAVAIRDGRVIELGQRDQVRAALPHARTVDLEGRVILPAFVDSHTHYHRAAVLRALYLDFGALRPGSISDVLASVGTRAAELPPGAWVQGDSISSAQLTERRLPNRHELDSVAPRNPVLIRGIGKHVGAANSLALAAAGIGRDTEPPSGGRIERESDGSPSGVLHEQAKLRLDASARDTVVPKPDQEQRLVALRAGVTEMHRLGVVGIHEMVRQTEEGADWAALWGSGDLRLRVRLYYRIHESPFALEWLSALGLRSGWGDDWLAIGGAKISVDGWCIFRNAAVYQPYRSEGTQGSEDPNLGVMRIEPARLTKLVREADRVGLQVAVHAVGARAVDAALDAFDAARPWSSGPHRIEHAHLDIGDAQLRRMAALGLILSAQPSFLSAYAADWRLVLPPERLDSVMRLRSAQDLGIPLLLNSDVPSGPVGPLGTILDAVRRGAGADAIGADEALTRPEAWQAHSLAAAALSGAFGPGHLQPGSPADLIVLKEDPFAEGAPLPTHVDATMVGGHVVHDPHGWLA